MLYSIRTKLTVAFAFTALICVILIGLFSNVQLEKHFKEYVLQNQIQDNVEIAEFINSTIQNEGTFDVHEMERIGVFALKRGLIISILDASGNILWQPLFSLDTELWLRDQIMASETGTKKDTYPLFLNNEQVGLIEFTFSEQGTYDAPS